MVIKTMNVSALKTVRGLLKVLDSIKGLASRDLFSNSASVI